MRTNESISDSVMFKEQLLRLKDGATLFFMVLDKELQDLISFAIKSNADINFKGLLKSLPEYANCKTVSTVKELKGGTPPKVYGRVVDSWKITNTSIISVLDLTVQHLNKFNFSLTTFLNEDDLLTELEYLQTYFSSYFNKVCKSSDIEADFFDKPYIVLFDVSRKEEQ